MLYYTEKTYLVYFATSHNVFSSIKLYDSNAINTDTKYSETGDICNAYLASSTLPPKMVHGPTSEHVQVNFTYVHLHCCNS